MGVFSCVVSGYAEIYDVDVNVKKVSPNTRGDIVCFPGWQALRLHPLQQLARLVLVRLHFIEVGRSSAT